MPTPPHFPFVFGRAIWLVQIASVVPHRGTEETEIPTVQAFCVRIVALLASMRGQMRTDARSSGGELWCRPGQWKARLVLVSSAVRVSSVAQMHFPPSA
ncbi:hypothetical protein GCM10023205_53330 [Yinghuangia aomiensis]|uniref:Secreted protein n=1 Tax=Yinghuangia aomiensis TaxID=676205 RepID=A0ABP9HU21_9ACTN